MTAVTTLTSARWERPLAIAASALALVLAVLLVLRIGAPRYHAMGVTYGRAAVLDDRTGRVCITALRDGSVICAAPGDTAPNPFAGIGDSTRPTP